MRWSQAPSSRTSRIVSNVEVFRCARDDQRMVRSNFAISEFWDGEIRVLSELDRAPLPAA